MAIKAPAFSAVNPMSQVASYRLAAIVINSTQASCDVVDIRGIKTMSVNPVSGGAAITTLTFYGCDTNNGTFVLINDLGTNGVVNVVDSKWQAIDTTKLAPHAFIQMKPDTTGTATIVGKN